MEKISSYWQHHDTYLSSFRQEPEKTTRIFRLRSLPKAAEQHNNLRFTSIPGATIRYIDI